MFQLQQKIQSSTMKYLYEHIVYDFLKRMNARAITTKHGH